MRTVSRSNAIGLTLLLSAAVLASAFGVPTTAAQSKRPRNVRDFFLLVPERYVGYPLEFRKYLLGDRSGMTVVDVKNGYISYDASDNPEKLEFAIFKKADGTYLAAYSIPYDPHEQSDSKFLLLAYDKGTWSDVTGELLPAPFDKKLSYKLPRRGREIIVTDEGGRQKYTLVWKGDKFALGGESK